MKSPRILALLLAASLVSLARADTSASLDVQLVSPPLAGFPLLLNLTITNTTPAGDPPPSFPYFGGDGIYPSANGFEARISDAAGHVLYRPLQNAQYTMGSRGGPHPIDLALTFPAVADGLPPGDYTLFIFHTAGASPMQLPPMRSPALKLTLHEDATALQSAAQEYSTAPAKIPPTRFNDFVGVTYGFSPIVNQWLATVAKPDADAEAVRTAAIYLAEVHRLPDGGTALLQQAITRLTLKPISDSALVQGRILQSLIQCAARQPADAAADIVLNATQGPAPLNAFAVQALGDCPPGKRVDDVLLTLSKSPDAAIARAAMIALGVRGNPAALAYVKEVPKITDQTLASSFAARSYATAATFILRGFPDNPDAVKLIRDAAADPQHPLHATGAAQLLARVQLIAQGPATRP